MYKYQNILAPVDFSNGSENAIRHAKDIAKSMGATIHLVHVISPFVYPTGIEFISENMLSVEKDMEEDANKKIQAIKAELESEGIKCVANVLLGKASVQILGYAKEKKMDLITIATHGVSGFEHFLFGSTTEKVIRKAHCPVLVVHFGKDD